MGKYKTYSHIINKWVLWRWNELIIDKNSDGTINPDLKDIEKKIIFVLETKVKPAVAKDGGDIKFLKYKDGIIIKLQGSCWCPSATITLKQELKIYSTLYSWYKTSRGCINLNLTYMLKNKKISLQTLKKLITQKGFIIKKRVISIFLILKVFILLLYLDYL